MHLDKGSNAEYNCIYKGTFETSEWFFEDDRSDEDLESKEDSHSSDEDSSEYSSEDTVDYQHENMEEISTTQVKETFDLIDLDDPQSNNSFNVAILQEHEFPPLHSESLKDYFERTKAYWNQVITVKQPKCTEKELRRCSFVEAQRYFEESQPALLKISESSLVGNTNRLFKNRK